MLMSMIEFNFATVIPIYKYNLINYSSYMTNVSMFFNIKF